LQSLKLKHATAIRTIIPYERMDRVADYDMRQQMRLVLGLKPTDNTEICACGDELVVGHAQACKKTRKLCADSRHNIMVWTVQQLIMSNSSLYVRREYTPPPIDGKQQTRQRPDLLIDGNVLADVVITTPTCKSYVERRIDAVAVVEKLKIDKYFTLARDTHSTFHALAFSAYGGWGKAALDGMSAIADRVAERGYTGELTRSSFLSRARRAVAVALAKGNANLVRTSLRLSHRRGMRSGGISFGGSAAGSVGAAAASIPVGGARVGGAGFVA
jgi:hypothetical protein